jgi:hypothetical protein
VDPIVGLDGCGKSHLHPDSIPGPSSPERVSIPTELSSPTNHINGSLSTYITMISLYHLYLRVLRPFSLLENTKSHNVSKTVSFFSSSFPSLDLRVEKKTFKKQ